MIGSLAIFFGGGSFKLLQQFQLVVLFGVLPGFVKGGNYFLSRCDSANGFSFSRVIFLFLTGFWGMDEG